MKGPLLSKILLFGEYGRDSKSYHSLQFYNGALKQRREPVKEASF
jgi:hypothetical protein